MLGLLSFVDPARRGTRRGPVAIAGLVLAVLAILWTPARAGETALADPVPTIDAPRRVIVSLSEGDERRISKTFNFNTR